jgi:hypothetical protein
MNRAIKIVLVIFGVAVIAFCIYEIALQSAYKRIENLSAQYGKAILPVITNEIL